MDQTENNLLVCVCDWNQKINYSSDQKKNVGMSGKPILFYVHISKNSWSVLYNATTATTNE